MKPFGLGLKITLFTFLLVVVTSGVLIYFSYLNAYNDLEKSIGQRLEAIAATGALMLDGDLHDQIKSPEDAGTEAFKKLQSVLREIKKSNNLEEEVYTFRRMGDNLQFIVMSHEKPFIGDPYQIKEEMWPALNEGKTSHTKIYKDKHGIWISAYAPIFDSNNQVSGILDIDIELKTFRRELAKEVRPLTIFSIVILAAAILFSFLLSRRLVSKLRYLTDITEKISTGQVDRTIKIKSRDEVGELADSLERMRVSLKIAMDMIDEDEKDTQ